MFTFIVMILCAFLLWLFSHFGIKNYEYDHSENMLTAKIINLVVFLILASLITINFIK
jgi:multisubunit Na+/H+ antiporter MnhB subunit